MGIGATSEVVYQAMRDVNSYYLFDHVDVVYKLVDDLTKNTIMDLFYIEKAIPENYLIHMLGR